MGEAQPPISLRGRPSDIRFPPICANCGQPATSRLPVVRVFGSSRREEPVTIDSFDVPFCASCAREHEAQSPPSDPLLLFKRLARAWPYSLPAVIIAGLGAKLAITSMQGALTGHLSPALGILLAILWGASISLLAVALHKTRDMAVPAVTSITSSFQFSGDLSETFEPEWRRYTCRHEQFAWAFEEINQSRLRRPDDATAFRARQLRWWGTRLLIVLIGLVAAYGIFDEYLRPIWEELKAREEGR